MALGRTTKNGEGFKESRACDELSRDGFKGNPQFEVETL